MKKLTQFFKSKKEKDTDEKEKKEANEEEEAEDSMDSFIVDDLKDKKKKSKKPKQPDEPVVCMTCGNRTKLFYDLTSGFQEEGPEDARENIEGYDLTEDRDPIRCVLCRKFASSKENEPIICEDCETNATIFYWTGKRRDIILCEECHNSS